MPARLYRQGPRGGRPRRTDSGSPLTKRETAFPPGRGPLGDIRRTAPPPDTEAFAFAMKAAFQLSEMQNEFFRKSSKGRMSPGTARLPFRGCAIKMVDAFFLAVPEEAADALFPEIPKE